MFSYNSIIWDSHADGPGLRVVLFAQGCPFGCPWCHSPHTRVMKKLLLFTPAMCNRCRRCASVCPVGAHSFIGELHQIDRSLCRGCGICLSVCRQSAGASSCAVLRIVPFEDTVESLFKKMLPQLRLCRAITVSGGEPLIQWQEVAVLLERCRSEGVDTAIETTLSAGERIIESLRPLVDRWLVGLRPIALNPPGVTLPDMAVVARNLRYLPNADITIRYPVIPGYTDHLWSMAATAEIMSSAGVDTIEILPYNENTGHYHRLMGSCYEQRHDYSPFALRQAVSFFRQKGYNVLTKP